MSARERGGPDAAVRIAPEALRAVISASEAAYPEEACGLLVGRADGGGWRIAAAHPGANLAASPRTAFEVDPGLRLALHKALRGAADDVVGVYHSHADSRAQPSARDLERAFEPDLTWLIVSVLDGQAVLTTAHRLAGDGRRFVYWPLVTDDWRPDPVREARRP